MKIVLFLLLLAGMWLTFSGSNIGQKVNETLLKTKFEMDAAARKRVLEERRNMHAVRGRKKWMSVLEKELYYSGLKLRLPKLTSEIFLALNLAVVAVITTVVSPLGGLWVVAVVVTVVIAVEVLVISLLKLRNLRLVNESLLKLLDFLGNYSITSGEVASVLMQVSRYMEEPVKTVLETCYYEAQTTGDTAGALLQMAEKVEHPKFKELACNMEVSLRYCADLSALVAGSRRSVMEYLRNAGERKGMLREALISMFLLLGMSCLVLVAVGFLVQMSPVELLIKTIPGRVGMVILGLIGVLFALQIRKVHY